MNPFFQNLRSSLHRRRKEADLRDELSVHGFRSTFSTWVAEETDTPADIREAALGHFNRDRIAAAYQRGDLLAKRRELMNRWATFAYGS